MRKLVLAFACVLLAACATADQPRQITTTVDNPYLQIVEPVTERVHVMRQALPNFAGVIGNVTIIEQSDSIVLVDSGNARGVGQNVVDTVRRISDKPVSAVIITHWHNDHPLGLPAIVAAWPDVEIIATEATRTRFAEGRTTVPTEPSEEYETRRHRLLTQDYVTLTETNAADPALSQEERDGWTRARQALDIRAGFEAGTYLMLPTRTFTDTLRLDDAAAPIEISFLGRANTDGDLVVWLPRQRVLVAGDLVVEPIPFMFSVYPEDNIRTLERLRGYDFATLVPGHGQQLHDKAYLDRLISLIRDTRSFAARHAGEGRTLEETTPLVLAELEPHAQAFAGTDPWLRAWFRDYAATPLIESAYREAKGEPLGPQ
jgi:glyoxylase-like metal-dependent hydrolase (beta-lactamase superfamily II)